jgi:alpha-galactosidase
MAFGAENLPEGLSVDPATGRMTGALAAKGEHAVTLTAQNAKGRAEKKFRIMIGDRIALTPPMGWNSWNCWAHAVDQEKVLRSARALVASDHQPRLVVREQRRHVAGARGASIRRFGQREVSGHEELCDEVHAMGSRRDLLSP